MEWILIIWLAFNNGVATGRGDIEVIVFSKPQECARALKAVQRKAKNVNGVCVPRRGP